MWQFYSNTENWGESSFRRRKARSEVSLGRLSGCCIQFRAYLRGDPKTIPVCGNNKLLSKYLQILDIRFFWDRNVSYPTKTRGDPGNKISLARGKFGPFLCDQFFRKSGTVNVYHEVLIKQSESYEQNRHGYISKYIHCIIQAKLRDCCRQRKCCPAWYDRVLVKTHKSTGLHDSHPKIHPFVILVSSYVLMVVNTNLKGFPFLSKSELFPW